MQDPITIVHYNIATGHKEELTFTPHDNESALDFIARLVYADHCGTSVYYQADPGREADGGI